MFHHNNSKKIRAVLPEFFIWNLLGRDHERIELGFNSYMADFVLVLRDAHNLIKLAFKLIDVADDTHKTMITGEILQYVNCRLQAFIIQRTEAFINKHSVQMNASSGTLHFVGKAQGKR